MRPHRTGLTATLLVASALTGCGDLVGPPPGDALPAEPPVAALQCTARVAARTVSCTTSGAAGGQMDRILGGQNVNVRLTSSNVSYDGTEVFAFDVTVQNLLVQKMGTADGTTITGVRVFFHGEPAVTSGTGSISVRNPAGIGLFTGSNQPYFEYPGTLSHLQTSAPQRWELSVPPSVNTFVFLLYLSTPLLPVVVFDKSVDGNRDIYRVALDGSDLVRLTTHPGTDQDATVAQGRVVFTSYRNGNADLYAVPVTGGTETLLLGTAAAETDPALSPDGTRLAFTRPVGGVTRLFTADGSGGNVQQVTTGSGPIESSPAWSAAGELAFMSTRNGGADIWLATLEGVHSVLVGLAGSNEVEPAFSADGGRVAFATNKDGDTELYLLNRGTGVLNRLTTRVGSDGSPSWLKDGRIVFTCYSGTTGRLCWMDPAQPGALTVIDTGPGDALRPWAVQF